MCVLRPCLLTSVLEFGQKSGCKVGGSEVRLGSYMITRGQGEGRGIRESFERIEETQRGNRRGGESMSIYKLKNYY